MTLVVLTVAVALCFVPELPCNGRRLVAAAADECVMRSPVSLSLHTLTAGSKNARALAVAAPTRF